jgi:hypothetical protein
LSTPKPRNTHYEYSATRRPVSASYAWRVTEHYPQLIESIVIVDLDDDDKIVRLVDQWGGKELPTRFGALYLRRISAMMTPWIVRVPR